MRELIKENGGYKLMCQRYNLGVDAMTVGLGEDFKPYVCQNEQSAVWRIEPVEKIADIERHTVEIKDTGMHLNNDAAAGLIATNDKAAATTWMQMPVGDAFTIVDTVTGKAVDISDGSREAGARLITYNISKADNQCFYMEKEGDGYLLKMKHSGLYLTYNEDGTITQEERDPAKKQVFIFK